MKTKLHLKKYVAILTFCFATTSLVAQLQVNGPNINGDIWGQVNPTTNVQSIGVGDFNTNSTWPQAAFHINTNSGFMPTSPTFNAGDVFLTDAPNDATFWRMWRGGNEYGVLYNNNDSHFYIQASDGSGNLNFNAGGANTWMTITSAGNVGIGTATPAYKLHVNGSFSAKQIYIDDKDLLALIENLQNRIAELEKLVAAK